MDRVSCVSKRNWLAVRRIKPRGTVRIKVTVIGLGDFFWGGGSIVSESSEHIWGQRAFWTKSISDKKCSGQNYFIFT